MIKSEWLYSTGYYYYRLEKDRIVVSMLPEIAENSAKDKIYVDIPMAYKARLELSESQFYPNYKLYMIGFSDICEHKYVVYTGLQETYKYCEKCNDKENN